MKKEKSIRRQLLSVLLYCWIVPVIAISVICLLYIQTAVKDRAKSSVRTGAAYAAQMTKQRLDTAVKEMRAVISDRALGGFYTSYSRTRDEKELLFQVRSELSRRFNLKSEYLFAGVSFLENSRQLITTSQYGAAYSAYYIANVRPRVLGTIAQSDNNSHLLVEGGNIYLFQNLLDNITLEKYGVIVLELSTQNLFQYFYEMDPQPEYAAIQLNNQMFWLTAQPDAQIKLTVKPMIGREEEKVGAERDYITASALNRYDDYSLGYRIFVNDSIITERAYLVVLIASVLCSLILPLLGYALLAVYRNITEPIGALVVATQRIENEQWDTTIVTTSDNEYGRLIRSFNKMSSKIKYLFDYAYREELAASESKLKMLQSQMNPHFLNNTLELINWKARLSNNEEISLMIEALGTLLDASLDRKGTKAVTLKEEISYMRSYLFIIEKRFGSRLTVNQHINERLYDCTLPRLIIQPLIENAVVHGIEPVAQGTIDVFVGKIGNELAIEIINDGAELSPEDEQRIQAILAQDDSSAPDKEKRLGIKNVQERLHLMYNEAGTLTIQRMADGKTLSRIRLPILRLQSNAQNEQATDSDMKTEVEEAKR